MYGSGSYLCSLRVVSHISIPHCFRYPEYHFISNKAFTKAASNLSNRYTETSLRGIILDSHFLSLTNYLVCGFSSNVRVEDYLSVFTLDHIPWLHTTLSNYHS